MDRALIIFLLFLFTNFSFAQTQEIFYVFAKKIEGGALLGIEQTSVKARVNSYNWTASTGKIFTGKTTTPTIKIPLDSGVRNISGTVVVKYYGDIPSVSKNFSFSLQEPRVSIAKYNNALNLTLPANNNLGKNDTLIALMFDFLKTPNQLTYKWLYDNKNVGEKNLLNLNVVNLVPGQSMRVIVSDKTNSREYAKSEILTNN